jgi:aminoglycoside phosphotransferase (APT) family kinase protein
LSDLTVEEALARMLAARCERAVEVRDFRSLAGGASARVYAFDADLGDGTGTRELVLRLDAVGGGLEGDRDEEFELLAAAARAGVTVPAVYYRSGPEEGFDGKCFVMDRIRGQAIARRLLREDAYEATRRVLPGQLAEELARIHAIDTDDDRLAFLARRAPSGDEYRFARSEVERYLGILDGVAEGRPYPVLRLAGRWLLRNAPTVDRPAVVHGDFRIGNVMFDEQGLTAVLDWELTHIGDPMEDLGWLCVRAWRFGADDRPVGGLAEREVLLERYARAAGRAVDASAQRYWELFGNWKWAIICLIQQARHKVGRWPDVELATIGRRVADSEAEILALLEEV